MSTIPKVEINSISFNKSRNDIEFTKYDIEVALDELESTEVGIKLKYGLTLLSNPKNIRINAEGIVAIVGDEAQTSKYLAQDENNIPNILNIIYQELFPLFYLLSKSMQVPCPAYKLSHVAKSSKPADAPEQITSEQITSEQITSEQITSEQITSEQITPEPLPELEVNNTQDLIVEPNAEVINLVEQQAERVF